MKIQHGLFALLLTSTFAPLMGCGSKPLIVQEMSCKGLDVYELGRRDGSQGLPSPKTASADELGPCVPDLKSPELAKYLIGRHAGLAEYCTQSNGVLVGFSDESYLHVCPELVEAEFLAGYNRGLEIRRMEEENETLQNEIQALSDQLAEKKSTKQLFSYRKKLYELRQKKLALEKKIRESDSSI